MSTIFTKTIAIIRAHVLLSALAAVLVIGGILWSQQSVDAEPTTETTTREVVVQRVSDLQSGNSLSIVAEVRSVSEATISTEAGGRVTRVRAELGDFVGAGQILAEVENGSQRAALLQAEGALDAVKAAVPNTEASLDSAKGTAVSTLLSAYAAAESAVHDTIDDTFRNPEGNTVKFLVLTSNSQSKNTLENTRPELSTILKRHALQSSALSNTSDLVTELAKTESELRMIRSFLDTLIIVLNAGISAPEMSASTIEGYLSDATSARAAITGSLSAIVASRGALEVALNNTGESGATNSASAASLKQAQGAYNAALAALERTIIRSPIAGSLNNFTIKLGDYLTPSQQVAIVSNNGALEAIAYVTPEDVSRIAVGRSVTLEGGTMGTVTRIAPALDPVTRRIEVRIGLPRAAATTLTNGQSIRIQLGEARASTTSTAPISIPITALRIESDRTIVFVVTDNKLAALPITIGKLSGEFVQVQSGLSADTEIVADARGLKEGEEVRIAPLN